LSKAFLVLIFKAWRIMVNRRAGFLVNNKGDRSFFFLSFGGDFLASRSFSFFKAVDSSAKHSLSPYMHYQILE